MTVKIDARDVFLVNKEYGGTKGIVLQAVRDKMTKKGTEVADLSFKSIKAAPGPTGRAVKQTLLPFVTEANRTINSVFGGAAEFLGGESDLPLGPAGGGKRINIAGVPSFNSANWPALSSSYMAKIKSGMKSGSRANIPKVFWSERSNWKKNHSMRKRGVPLRDLLAQSGFGHQNLKSDLFSVQSREGHKDTVSFSTSLHPARRAIYTSKKGLLIGGVHGDIFMPTLIKGIGGGPKAVNMYKRLYGALGSGLERETGRPSLGINSKEGPNLLQLLLVNEYRRPFMGRAFAKANSLLIENLRKLALSTK